MSLPAPVGAICRTFLDVVRPGLVTGLYLRGGIGFGEWIDGQSDVDFVATLARRPTGDDLRELSAAHEKVAVEHPDVPFDGAHVLAADLTGDPEKCPDVPCILHRHFEAEARYDISPVTWHEGAREDACCWCVLGVARLDHLLVTGDMTTKSGAGRWGLTHYPVRFHRVLREALRIREGGRNEYPDTDLTRGQDTADFTAYVVEHAGGD